MAAEGADGKSYEQKVLFHRGMSSLRFSRYCALGRALAGEISPKCSGNSMRIFYASPRLLMGARIEGSK